MESRFRSAYNFDGWRLETDRYCLSHSGQLVSLRPKTFRVLQYLLHHSNRVVGKTELLDAVWPDVLVDESVLSQCVGELRKVLGDDVHNPHYIETISRVGYVFIASVKESVGKDGAVPSIAVLPFVDMSPSQDQVFLCKGIAEQIINGLAQIKAIRVAARTSSFSLGAKDVSIEEIGICLKVEFVLEGSLRRVGNRIRLAVQLISVEDGYHRWSTEYDRNLEDLFDLQDEIALEVVENLRIELASPQKTAVFRRQTTNKSAYFAYLKGRNQLLALRDFGAAVRYYQEAIESDPNFAAPYAGLSVIYGNQMVWAGIPRGKLLPKMSEAANKAMELDPSLAETHFAMCFLKAHELNRRVAEKEGRLAIKLNPRLPEAYVGLALCHLSLMGKHEESVEVLRQALEVDPISPYTNYWMGVASYLARNNLDAIWHLEMALELDSKFDSAHWYLGLALFEEGHFSKATESFAAVGAEDHPYVLVRSGRRRQAVSALENWHGNRVAQTKAALGDLDGAFARLKQVYTDPMVAYSPEETALKVDPVWDPLRGDLRFGKLLQLRNLTD